MKTLIHFHIYIVLLQEQNQVGQNSRKFIKNMKYQWARLNPLV